MRAKLVEQEFKRGRDPKDQMGIGLGPIKYIGLVEDVLDSLGFKYGRSDSLPPYGTKGKPGDSKIEMELADPNFGALQGTFIYLIRKKEYGWHDTGWYFKPLSNNFYQSPHDILEYILKYLYVSNNGRIKDMEAAIIATKDENVHILSVAQEKLGLTLS